MKNLNTACRSRNPAHTAQYRCPQAPCRCRRLFPATAVAPAAATAGTAAGSPEESYAAVQQLVADRALDPDPALVAQEAHLTLSYLSSQPGALPQDLQHAAQLADHALRLTDLMATGSTFKTLQMLKRHPALLHLSAHEVSRVGGWCNQAGDRMSASHYAHSTCSFDCWPLIRTAAQVD